MRPDLYGEASAVDRFAARLSADPIALARIRERLAPPRPRTLAATLYVLAAFLIAGGIFSIVWHGRPAWSGWFYLIYGIVYGPLAFWYDGRLRRRAVFVPAADDELVIDDAGLTILRDRTRIAWREVSAVRDLGEAFVFVRGYRRPSIVLFTSELPDGGRTLWNALDARLVSAYALVRGTSARTTIRHTAR